MNYTSDVIWFKHRMLKQLSANSHKGGWTDLSDFYLFKRLVEEVEELQDVLMSGKALPEDVINEAADIANFAMMIATAARRREKTKHV